MNEKKSQEQRINKLLNEANSLYSDIQFLRRYTDCDYLNEKSELEDKFIEISKALFFQCLVYFEYQNIPETQKRFLKELEPYIYERSKLLSGTFYSITGEIHSNYTSNLWYYVSSFSFMHSFEENIITKSSAIKILENILESTAVIIEDLGVTPKSETEVYKAVKILTKAAFSNANFPTRSFQKTAKCYIPDILIPSLYCAVEYKYAETEKRLVDTIDQILIDVKGYDKNPSYKLFYAVFYVKPGIWTKSRFDEVWKEKGFPANWKGILIIGK